MTEGRITSAEITDEFPMILSCEGLDRVPEFLRDGLLDMIRDTVAVLGNVSEAVKSLKLETCACTAAEYANDLYGRTSGDSVLQCQEELGLLNDNPELGVLLYMALGYARCNALRGALKAKGE